MTSVARTDTMEGWVRDITVRVSALERRPVVALPVPPSILGVRELVNIPQGLGQGSRIWVSDESRFYEVGAGSDVLPVP